MSNRHSPLSALQRQQFPWLSAVALGLLSAIFLVFEPGALSAARSAPTANAHAPSANDLMADAQAALKQQHYSAAVGFLKPLLKAHPDYAPGWFDLAYAFTGLRQNSNAVQAYRQAIRLQPDMFEAHLNLGILLLETHQPAAALPELERAAKLRPNDPRPHLYAGRAYAALHQAAQATQALQTAIRLQSQNPRTYFMLGQLYLTQKNFAGARDAFQKSASLDPALDEAKLGAAIALSHLGDPAQAIKYYQQYLAAHPADFSARFNLASLELDQHQAPEAVANLQEIEKLDPGFKNLDVALGDAYTLLNQFPESEKYYRQALASAPNSSTLHRALADTLLHESKLTKAESEFRSALRLDPKNFAAAQGLALALYLEKRYSDAIPLLRAALQTPQASLETYFALATCYDHLHQLKPAIQAYQAFLSVAHGEEPDQEWQAQQRIRLLREEMAR